MTFLLRFIFRKCKCRIIEFTIFCPFFHQTCLFYCTNIHLMILSRENCLFTFIQKREFQTSTLTHLHPPLTIKGKKLLEILLIKVYVIMYFSNCKSLCLYNDNQYWCVQFPCFLYSLVDIVPYISELMSWGFPVVIGEGSTLGNSFYSIIIVGDTS